MECRRRVGVRNVIHVGYDLFDEVQFLLSIGQPAENSLIPTLELHIEKLRSLLLETNTSFVEVPPRPEGYAFICCLTHDIDFHGIRRHIFDRTFVGFTWRASWGSLVGLIRGRRSLADLLRNWLALGSVPFVYLRLLPDLWRPFEDYARAEDTSRSTFFVVPFRNVPGIDPSGRVNQGRAVKYGAADIRGELEDAVRRGSEIGVHGIDAWNDAHAANRERMQVNAASGCMAVGVRMHWLYFGPDSPAALERAGFDYDSTYGYNDAVGYRAGTSQSFKLLRTDALMELPLSVMDSALFYPRRMGLSTGAAWTFCDRILKNAVSFGGTIVVNWHDRSLSPERLWGAFYKEFVCRIANGRKAWFTTAANAVLWFRSRRNIRFEQTDASMVMVTRTSISADVPAPTMLVYRAGNSEPEQICFDNSSVVAIQL